VLRYRAACDCYGSDFQVVFGFVCLGELLYVYDLVVIADSEKEVIRKFYVWKDGLEMIEGEFV